MVGLFSPKEGIPVRVGALPQTQKGLGDSYIPRTITKPPIGGFVIVLVLLISFVIMWAVAFKI